jgi:DNA-binding NarL/FixJ family response regulator
MKTEIRVVGEQHRQPTRWAVIARDHGVIVGVVDLEFRRGRFYNRCTYISEEYSRQEVLALLNEAARQHVRASLNGAVQ